MAKMMTPTFKKALESLKNKGNKTKIYLKDKRLSQIERKLLTTYLLIRDSKYEEATQLIQEIPNTENEFINGTIELYKGLIANNTVFFTKAVLHFLNAQEFFKSIKENHFSFVTSFNLFVTYFNRNEVEKVANQINILKSYQLKDHYYLKKTLEAEVDYLSLIDSLDDAQTKLNTLLSLKPHSERDRFAHIFCQIEIYNKKSEYKKSMQELAKINKLKKFYMSSYYTYTKALLNLLIDNKPIYIKYFEYQDTPILKLNLEYLKSLTTKDFEEQRRIWNKLRTLSPLYSQDGIYTGHDTLFKICLNKSKTKQENHDTINNFTITEKLYDIFINKNLQLTQEELIKILFEENITTENKNKLKHNLYKFRKKHDLQIKIINGKYQLINAA